MTRNDKQRRGRGQRNGLRSLLVGLQLLVLASPAIPAATYAAAVVSEPPVAPHQIIVFPARDFVSASGYAADDRVVVSVIHPNGTTFTTDPANPIVPQDDPRAAAGAPFAGIVEVNHPGGACWFGTTPDIRPGDKVRIEVVAGPNAGKADQTTVASVTAQRPVQVNATTVQVHGTAQDALGNPLPLGQLEQRLVANRQVFLLNGRRVLTTAKDGTFAYDTPGSPNWTATYTGLQAADVDRALGAESRVLWLGRDPLAGTEATIFENGAGVFPGPAAPCTAPIEFIPPPPGSDQTPPTAPTGLTATVSNSNSVTLSWTAATDNVGVTSYGIYRDGLPIFNVSNPDGSAPAPTTFVDTNVPPGTYVYTVDAADAIGNRSPLSNPASATTSAQAATLPPGTIVNEPPVAPIEIIPFPTRDFISAGGFLATDTVTVQLLRWVNGTLTVVSTATGVIPQQDPRAGASDPFAGIVEVNHPGGACWEGVTPDIRVGDVVRLIAYNPDGSIRTVDQTTTANVVTERPRVVKNPSSATAADGIVEVHGVAMDKNGVALPIDQMESRLIANRDRFALNGRRTLRAGMPAIDGTLAYDANDPASVHWTATYGGLVQQDIDRILGLNGFPGAETRILWLGVQPLAGTELTIYENGDALANGPSAPCTTPQEPMDTFAPSVPALSAAVSGLKDVQLTWSASTDNVGVYGYGLYRDGVRIRNFGGATTSFLDRNVAPGNHTYAVDAVDAATPALQPGIPLQSLPWGNRSAQSAGATILMKDTTSPSVPQNLVALADAGSVRLTWSASSDDVAVTSYGIYRDAVKIADVPALASPAQQKYTDTLTTLGTFTYTVDAADAAGNRSALSAPATVIASSLADTTPPTAPAGLQATVGPNWRDVTLTWSASTDNVGVTGYGVYRNGTKVADLGGSTLTYTELNVPGGTYVYTVDAVDSAGNRSAQSTSSTAMTANQPPVAPHSIVAFPQRDFVSASGYALSEGPVTVRVLRKNPATGAWNIVSTSTPVTPFDDPKTAGFEGLVEVNHPGGGCWTGVTPDLRPGDIVRFTNAQGVSDQIVVQNVTAQRPVVVKPATGTASDGIVAIHGTAQDAAGRPLPLGSLEQRLIANKDLFAVNGRRMLRADGVGADGVLAYDAPGSINWTATYSGLSGDDVARAVGGISTSTGKTFAGSESRILWLGADPLAGVDLTIFENGDTVVGGPSAPCAAPAETPVARTTLSSVKVTFADQAVTSPATAGVTQTITLVNSGGAPLAVTVVALVGMNPGDFQVTGDTCSRTTLAAGGNCSVSVRFAPTAGGTRTAGLDFQDNAANAAGFVALSGKGLGPAPVISSPPPSTAASSDVQVSGSASTGSPLHGTSFSYTWQVKNNSGATAMSVVLTDTLPSGLTYVSALSSAGACTMASGTVTCSLGNLAVGAQANVTIVVTAPPAPVASLSNTAIVNFNGPDSNTANNVFTVKIKVL